MFLNPNITDQEILQKEKELRSMSYDQKTEVWQELHKFFGPKETSVNDQKYWYSYFRWYVELTARRFIKVTKEVLIDDVASRMIPMMYMLDEDVWQQLMYYFTLLPFEKKELESLYAQIRKRFLESDSIVGTYKGKEVRINELVKEITILNNQGNDSLKMADLRTKIRQIFFPGGELEQRFIFADKDLAISRFIDLVHFFLGVKADDIFYIVDAYENKAKYAALQEQQKLSPTEESALKKVTNTIPNQESQSPTDDQAPQSSQVPQIPQKQEQTSAQAPDTNSQKPTPTKQEIKQQVEATFEQDANGQFTNIQEVITHLHVLADTYQDPAIAELLYYDQESGVFVWDI